MTTRNIYGNPVRRNIRRQSDGSWAVTVWWGGLSGCAAEMRRYYYETRRQARGGDISDDIGQHGRVHGPESFDEPICWGWEMVPVHLERTDP